MTHNNSVFTSLIVNVYVLYLSFHNILSYTYPTAGVTAPVWHGGRALALLAPVFRAVGTRTGLPPVGIGPRAWTAVPAVWVPSRTRSKNEEVVVNSTQEKMATFRIIRVCVCVCVFWEGWGPSLPGFWPRPWSGLGVFGDPGWARRARPALRLDPSWTPTIRFRWGAWPLLP